MRAFLVLVLLFSGCGTNTFTSGDGGPSSDGAADGPSEAGAIDLRAQGNLVLWLDASKGVMQMNQRVALWADQSGNGNDAHAVLGAPGVPGPLYVQNAVGGRPALHFEANAGGNVAQGCMLAVDDKQSLRFGAASFVIEMVVRWTNDPTQAATTNRGALFAKGGIGNTGVLLMANNALMSTANGGAAGVVGTSAFGTLGTAYNDDTWRTVGLVRDITMAHLRVGGKIDGTVGVATQDASSSMALLIGAAGDQAGTFRLNGDIAEIIVYANNAPPAPVIEGYLRAKYGL